MLFADKVKFARMKLHLSQAQFEKEFGVSFATLIGGKTKDMSHLVSLGRFNDFCEKTYKCRRIISI